MSDVSYKLCNAITVNKGLGGPAIVYSNNQLSISYKEPNTNVSKTIFRVLFSGSESGVNFRQMYGEFFKELKAGRGTGRPTVHRPS